MFAANVESLKGVPKWQRERMQALHEICIEIERLIADELLTLKKAVKRVLGANAGRMLPTEQGDMKPLRISVGGLNVKLSTWRRQGRTIMAFKPSDRQGGKARIPRELVNEYHREATKPGVVSDHAAYDQLCRRWKAGEEIPGLGTWQKWFSTRWPKLAIPTVVPEFPFTYSAMQRLAAGRALKKWGRRGMAAALKDMPWIERDPSQLRPGELIVFDDARLDLIAIDELTKRPTEHKVYLAMEWGSRLIPAYILRPGTSLISNDVDSLVCMALKAVGIPKDRPAHLYFEQGTLTMSDELARFLRNVSGGRFQVHFSKMNRSRPYTTAPMEEASGHWMAKAVIESFFRRLHSRLTFVPGQRGSNYMIQPATLGWTGQDQRPKPGTLVAEAQKLLEIEMSMQHRIRLNLGIMWTSEVHTVLDQAIADHNNARGHDYAGHGMVTVRRSPQGVLEDVTC